MDRRLLVWVIYQIKILEHLMLSLYLILESLNESERILIYLSYGVIIRDKVGNFGQVWQPNTLRKRVEFAHKNSFYSVFLAELTI